MPQGTQFDLQLWHVHRHVLQLPTLQPPAGGDGNHQAAHGDLKGWLAAGRCWNKRCS